MPVASPTDRRFRRSHVSPTRRRSRVALNRRLAICGALAVVVLYAGYQAAPLLLSIDALTVSNITVSGNRKLSVRQVRALLEPLRGQNMLYLDLDEARRTLMQSPWVADAALRRELPGKVDIVIVEREPAAIGRFNQGLFLLDAHGGIVDEFGPHHSDLDLPLVDGLAGPDTSEGNPTVDPTRAALALGLLAALAPHPDLADRLSQVDVTDPQDAVVILKGDTTLVHVGDERFVERLRTYVDIGDALRERVPQIDAVDLRYGERVYVKPLASPRRAANVMAARTDVR